MTNAVMPNELLSEQEMGPIQQLIQEVKNQQGKNPRTLTSDLEPVHTIQSALPIEPNHDSDSNGGWRLVGTRRDGRNSRDDAKHATGFQCTGSRYFPSDAFSADESVSTSTSSSSSSSSSHQDCWNAHQWSPCEQSRISQPARPCRDGGKSSRSDPDCTGNVGTKDGHLGTQAQGRNLCPSLRDRRRVCQVGHGPGRESARGNGGLLQLHHNTTSPRSHGTAEREALSEWQPVREGRWHLTRRCKPSQHVHDAHEGGWIKEMYKLAKRGGNQCEQIDLLRSLCISPKPTNRSCQQMWIESQKIHPRRWGFKHQRRTSQPVVMAGALPTPARMAFTRMWSMVCME